MSGTLSRIERAVALLQGKGYGTATIRREVRAAAKLLDASPQLVVDVGGNIGAYTQEVLARFPQAEVHVFEPAPKNVAILRQKFAGNPRVTLQDCALGSETGTAVLFADTPGSGMASLTRRRLEHFGIRFDHQDTVRRERFEDYWMSALGGRVIDLVKLDVEGHELEVLKGFGPAIEKTRVVQFEFGGCNIDTRTYFQDFWYYFKSADFEIYRVAPFFLQRISAYSEIDEFFSTTNFLARSRR
jgi:FkbM family methyltransferase